MPFRSLLEGGRDQKSLTRRMLKKCLQTLVRSLMKTILANGRSYDWTLQMLVDVAIPFRRLRRGVGSGLSLKLLCYSDQV